MPDIDETVLRRAVAESRDGVAIADARLPDLPLIYVNAAFEAMTGYTAAEVLGTNCRFLQGDLRDQEGLKILRESIAQGEPCVVTLKNFRKDGSLFWNELSMSPIRDAHGELTHFLAIQRDVSSEKLVEFALHEERAALAQATLRLEEDLRTDALTGLSNRGYLDERLGTMLQRAAEEGNAMAVMLIDLDDFKGLNDRLGHLAGDEALQRVGDCLKQCRRCRTDVAARYGGEEFALVCQDLEAAEAQAVAERLVKRVRGLEVTNPASPGGILTTSVGWVWIEPGVLDRADKDQAIAAADEALYAAKRDGRNRAKQGTLGHPARRQPNHGESQHSLSA